MSHSRTTQPVPPLLTSDTAANGRYCDQYTPTRARGKTSEIPELQPERLAGRALEKQRSIFWNCHCRFFKNPQRGEYFITIFSGVGWGGVGVVHVHPGSDPAAAGTHVGRPATPFSLAQWKSGVRNMTPGWRFQSSRRARSACRPTGPARGLGDAVTSLAAPTQHGSRDKNQDNHSEAAACDHRHHDDDP